MLAPWAPAVIDTRRVPADPCPARHLTDVSDTHSDDSHPVCPSPARPVFEASPMLDPCTVTDDDPVPAPFVRRTVLSLDKSTDHDLLELPLFPAVLSTSRVVPLIP